MKTKWICKDCNGTGTVEHDEHDDVMSVLVLVFDDHRRVSPDCLWNPHRIRVSEGSGRLR